MFIIDSALNGLSDFWERQHKKSNSRKRNNMSRILETAEERVKLLKAGLIGKTIEKLYIESNSFKIVLVPAIIELVELGHA